VSHLADPPGHKPWVERQLCATFRTLGLEPAVYQPAKWACLADMDSTRLHHPFGWLPPSLQCWAGSNTVPCCPKIVEQQTSGLPAEKRAHYLVALAVSAAMHVRFQQLAVAQRSAAVDSELYEFFPDVLRALTDVSMAALDDRPALSGAADSPGGASALE
jgi:hypothetical protein